MSTLQRFKKSNESFVSIAAPMVRYSKLPFRLLVREYGCDLAYTPMIMANSFVQSAKAMESEFSTCREDRPLIVQFASHDPVEFVEAVRLVADCSDGVDLNCGCPQRWAIQEGIGCGLLRRPERICDIVREFRRADGIPSDYCVSVKIRLLGKCKESMLKETVEMLRRLDCAGVDWVTVHARTMGMRSEPALWDTLREVISAANTSCDTVLNGDVSSLAEARTAHEITGCTGVMAARGLLESPHLFWPQYETVSAWEPARRYLDLAMRHGHSHLLQLHQHLFWMLQKQLARPEAALLHAIGSVAGIVRFMEQRHTSL